MKEKYEKELSKIKAPKELIERTKNEVHKEMLKENGHTLSDSHTHKRMIKITVRQATLVSAAILIIFVGTATYFNTKNTIAIQEISDTSMVLNPTLSKRTAKDTSTKASDTIKTISSNDKTIVPTFLSEVKKSKISGHHLQIAKDKNNTYYAAYKLENTYYYVVGEDVSKTEFIDYLKNKF